MHKKFFQFLKIFSIKNNNHTVLIKKNFGIGLLDIVIAITIASIMTTLLYQSLNQTTRTVKRIDTLIDINSQLALFSTRLEKDLAGVFITNKSRKIEEDFLKSDKEKDKKSLKEEDTGCFQDNCAVFFLDNMKTSLKGEVEKSIFTFVTTNPLFVYGENIPRKVRVAYALKQDKRDTKFFKLLRFESNEVDYKKFRDLYSAGKIPGYELANNILNFEISCVQIVTEKEKDKKDKIQIKTLEFFNDFDQLKKKINLFPNFVKVKGIFVDSNKKNPREFEFIMPIFVSEILEEKKEEVSDKDKNKQDQAVQQQQQQQQQQSGIPKVEINLRL